MQTTFIARLDEWRKTLHNSPELIVSRRTQATGVAQRRSGFIVVFSPGFAKSLLPLTKGEKVAGGRMRGRFAGSHAIKS